MIQFSKGELVTITDSILNDIYYWKYEEKQQEAKKWNGPYIHEPILDKATFFDQAKQTRYIYSNVESTLAIMVEGQFVGTVGTYWLEIGIVIYDSAYWESGIGTEVFKLWIDYLFENHFVHRLGISTWSGNERMIKLAAKAGMKEEARIRQARIVEGQFYDAIKMGILKNEWANNS
ncbi:GNAT family N-acetyltransferase [Staphylococcus edaphicus]|uniref:GNAT family N-acetyltransferase n=1 Tax=Staphylococcus edaphicus TaxID=1955013 RepID=A0A2C6U588_9STAP|nr:GNAT family protein [Staphylococcus edaphicus]PHK49022.1 GNAT family N-acetyltransferase [Staphylococcus edaphicus]UQW81347.1 GNAT family N-acetyltransferase [Staphylococcus edaphicus]